MAVAGTAATDFSGAYPKGLPSTYQTELQSLSKQGKLSGLPPQVLAYIMEAESGPSYEGGGWNGVAGGWFGLEVPDGLSKAQITDPSIASFDLQAQTAAALFAKLLGQNSGNPIAAENEYQTGHPNVAANGAGIFQGFGLLNDTNALIAGAAGAASAAGGVEPASPTPLGPLGSGVNVGGGVSLGWATDLDNFLQDITGGFGIGWKAVLTIIGGILLIGVGILVLFRHQAGEAASLAAM